MGTLGLTFKKIESDDRTKYDTFYSQSKAETIWKYLNQSRLKLYQPYKKL